LFELRTPEIFQEQAMNTQDFEASLKADNYDEINTVSKDIGYQMGAHQHTFDACALITAGQIEIEVDGVSTCFKVGDVFRLSAGTVHTENASQFGVSYLVGRRNQDKS
jgi:quercetin dioxygenase-like cupin family protein